MVELLTVVIIIAGAVGGLLRTINQHEGRLVWPMVNVKRWTFRLGFPASVIIGAIVSYFADLGIVVVAPFIVPDNIYTAALFGLFVGFMSLHILNKVLGLNIEDPDVCEIQGLLVPSSEKNEQLIEMYQRIEEEMDCIERVRIFDGQTAGVLKAVAVPKKGNDPRKVKMKVESVLNRIKHPGIQVYVYLPEEIEIDMGLTVEVLNGDDPSETRAIYAKKVEDVVRRHIDSLQPGESVYRSQLVAEIVSIDTYIKDVRGEKMNTTPGMKEGRVPIGAFQVARAGKIDVSIIIRTVGRDVF